MTPKEKAEDLIDSFLRDGYAIVMENRLARRCALIAVNEILNQDKNVFDIYEREYHFEYWGNVKDEIEQL